MLTLAEFRASGRDTDSIGFAVDDSALEGVPGRVYLACLYIERLQWVEGQRPAGAHDWLLPGVLNTLPDFSGSLAECEARLYAWAITEGYCDSSPAAPPAPAARRVTRDILREAFRTSDLDAACLLIQDALGIESGDTAGVYLGDKYSEWAMASGWGRAELLVPWLRAELLEAGEAHGPVESEDEAKRQSYARDEPGEAPARPSVTLDRTR